MASARSTALPAWNTLPPATSPSLPIPSTHPKPATPRRPPSSFPKQSTAPRSRVLSPSRSLPSVVRATVGETRIERVGKIDSRVQTAHACTVGDDNVIRAPTCLASSNVLEPNVVLAGQRGTTGHLTVHDGPVVYAQCGIG